MGVYGRVANVLLEFAEPDETGQLLIREKISRQDIAKMVGASREMVSRVMKDLEAGDYIGVDAQRRIHVRHGARDGRP